MYHHWWLTWFDVNVAILNSKPSCITIDGSCLPYHSHSMIDQLSPLAKYAAEPTSNWWAELHHFSWHYDWPPAGSAQQWPARFKANGKEPYRTREPYRKLESDGSHHWTLITNVKKSLDFEKPHSTQAFLSKLPSTVAGSHCFVERDQYSTWTFAPGPKSPSHLEKATAFCSNTQKNPLIYDIVTIVSYKL